MIFHIYYVLIMAGYAACSVLLGSYMMYYAGSTEVELGFLFMIQPATILLRPLICAHADRYQSHQQMMALFSLLVSLAYVPFIVLPFVTSPHGKSHTDLAVEPPDILDERIYVPINRSHTKFWLLVAFQLIGSIGFCGVRSLGDALAINYAKRIGADFARYRKFGSMSYGVCGLALGTINQGWLLPDFVPVLIVYSASMLLLAVLVYAWPHEYFEMSSTDMDDKQARLDYLASLPSASATVQHISGKLVGGLLLCGCCRRQDESDKMQVAKEKELNGKSVSGSDSHGQWSANLAVASSNGPEADLRRTVAMKKGSKLPENVRYYDQEQQQQQQRPSVIDDRSHKLSVKQQLSIFALLLRRDFRISLYLLAIFFGGLVGYSGPNFVFTYINVVCHTRGTCDGAQLTGLVMFCYCVVETIVYMLLDKFRGRLNRVLMIEITFISLIIHYYFYGFALEHLSPYFFLMESLHGVEYAISLSTSLELGYYFASEVELLLPELVERGIISEHDDEQLIKVSLMATMSGCYTLVYDGFGCILGSLAFGIITGHYSFIATWITIGSLATIGFVTILFVYSIGKCFKIRPTILGIRDRRLAAAAGLHTST